MEPELIKKRLQMLEKRIDNLDPVVSALVERIMSRTAVVRMTCPRCGSVVRIMLTSSAKSGSKG